MLQVTIDRISTFVPMEQVVLVAGDNIREAILAGCPSIKRENLFSEPFGRNTCLAIGCAAVHLQKRDPDGIMVVLSADHLIDPVTKLLDVIKTGVKIASEGNNLVTIGIVPSRPETGYGYIELSDEQWDVGNVTVCKVLGFKEKPRPMVAQQYYYGGKHLWNSGMFVWSIRAIMESLAKCQPDMHKLLMEYSEQIGTTNEESARMKLYKEAEPISIDYAILEQADNVLTLKGDFVWDDVGSWLALQRFKPTDEESNVVVGRSLVLDTFESTIYNAGEGVIAVMGVSDLVVAKVGDAVLVSHKTKLSQMKDLLSKIAKDEYLKKYL